MSWKIVITPITVPKNPNIGAIDAMMARMEVFFSRFEISNLPEFSMAPLMSSKGLPMRTIPFPIMRATGVLVVAQRFLAESNFP